MRKNTLFIELNEVPFTVWDRYAQRHPGSAIRRLLDGSSQYTTVTSDQGFVGNSSPHAHLTPWTTWPTVHRGVDNTVHGILDIGQDLTQINKDYPAFWTYLADAGKPVGVFGSLHSWPVPDGDYAFYVPDPFAVDDEVIPDSAKSFQTFSLGATRTSGRNVDAGIDLKSAASFVANAPRMGVKAGTALKVARQLADERKDPTKATRRRAFQPIIGFDIYEKLVRVHKPEVSTFFMNHVAAAMHRYWAAAYPGDYTEHLTDPEWVAQYSDEIDYAMGAVDQILERLLNGVAAQPNTALVVASSMGQAPTVAKQVTTELQVEDQTKFMSALGVPAGAWRRTTAMFPNFNIFVDAQYQDIFRRLSSTFRINGFQIDRCEAAGGFFSLDFGQPNLGDLVVELDGRTVPASEVGLNNMVITDKSLKCADHVPEGSLLVHDSGSQPITRDREQVASTAIAPSILARHRVAIPSHMTAATIPAIAD